MDKKTKYALGVAALFSVVQGVASQLLLQHCEKVEKENIALRGAGLYMINICDREEVELTEFDRMALKVFFDELDKQKKDTGPDEA